MKSLILLLAGAASATCGLSFDPQEPSLATESAQSILQGGILSQGRSGVYEVSVLTPGIEGDFTKEVASSFREGLEAVRKARNLSAAEGRFVATQMENVSRAGVRFYSLAIADAPYGQVSVNRVWWVSGKAWVEDIKRLEASNDMVGRREVRASLDGDLLRQQWSADGELQIQQADVGRGSREGVYRNGVLYHVNQLDFLLKAIEPALELQESGEGGKEIWRASIDLLPLFAENPEIVGAFSSELKASPGRLDVEVIIDERRFTSIVLSIYRLEGDLYSRSSFTLDDAGQILNGESLLTLPLDRGIASLWACELLESHPQALEGEPPFSWVDGRAIRRILPSGRMEIVQPGNPDRRDALPKSLIDRFVHPMECVFSLAVEPRAERGAPDLSGSVVVVAESERTSAQIDRGAFSSWAFLIESSGADSFEVIDVRPSCPCMALSSLTEDVASNRWMVTMDVDQASTTDAVTLFISWKNDEGLHLHRLTVAFDGEAPSALDPFLGRYDQLIHADEATIEISSFIDIGAIHSDLPVELSFSGQLQGSTRISDIDRRRRLGVLRTSLEVQDGAFGLLQSVATLKVGPDVIDAAPFIAVRRPPAVATSERGSPLLGCDAAQGGSSSGNSPVFFGPPPAEVPPELFVDVNEEGRWTIRSEDLELPGLCGRIVHLETWFGTYGVGLCNLP